MNAGVQEYFDRAANDFDAIYEGRGLFRQWVDRHFRRDMYERYLLTFETCGNVIGKTILDIGCGGGHYSIEFAKRGASQVVGLDLASNMVKLADQYAEKDGLKDRCRFIAGDFWEINLNRHFDIALAIGVFDYISRPRPFLEKMRTVAKEWLIVSFPSKSPIRTPIRKARYWWKRCPVYFYDRRMIETLVAGLGRYRILKIPGQGMDYFVSIQLCQTCNG